MNSIALTCKLKIHIGIVTNKSKTPEYPTASLPVRISLSSRPGHLSWFRNIKCYLYWGQENDQFSGLIIYNKEFTSTFLISRLVSVLYCTDILEMTSAFIFSCLCRNILFGARYCNRGNLCQCLLFIDSTIYVPFKLRTNNWKV